MKLISRFKTALIVNSSCCRSKNNTHATQEIWIRFQPYRTKNFKRWQAQNACFPKWVPIKTTTLVLPPSWLWLLYVGTVSKLDMPINRVSKHYIACWLSIRIRSHIMAQKGWEFAHTYLNISRGDSKIWTYVRLKELWSFLVEAADSPICQLSLLQKLNYPIISFFALCFKDVSNVYHMG